jgi:16S rRNA (guanine966-N2)-methyltransferase
MVGRSGGFPALRANAAALDAGAVELKRADALEFLRADDGFYDVVFLDPPFRADYLSRVLPALIARLAGGAMVHVEAPRALRFRRNGRWRSVARVRTFNC